MQDIFIRSRLKKAVLEPRYDLTECLIHLLLSKFPGMHIRQALFGDMFEWLTYSRESPRSGFSSCSTRRRIPLLMSALTLLMAWTVCPKCLPWWIRGSELQLPFKISYRLMRREARSVDTYTFFLGPICNAPILFWPTEESFSSVISDGITKRWCKM